MPKFKLTGDNAGESLVLNDRYQFVDGEMVVSKASAELLEPILCGYYACVLEQDETIEEVAAPASNSLDKSVTSSAPEPAPAPASKTATAAKSAVAKSAE